MNCQKVRCYLSASCDGSLQSDLCKEMEAHIRNCKSCEREKLYIEEILVAAKSLPQKQVADDFNLQLMNRIFAEQNHQTESYLPLREPSLFRRPLAWMSSLATVGVVAVLTMVFLRSDKAPEMLDDQSVITATIVPPAEQTAQFASVTTSKESPTVWEYILGVSGERSNYRATTVSNARSLKLADAKIESLYVEHMRRMGLMNRTMNRPTASFASSQYQSYRPYVRPVNPYQRNSPDTPLLRNASWR
ncbi:MAG: zf-HC2 domain-containing protein [bacterium]|nr:zf-HC2 domain-containing protein [bacterium]